MDSERLPKWGWPWLRAAQCALLMGLAACGSKASSHNKSFTVVLVSVDWAGEPDADQSPNLFELKKRSTHFGNLKGPEGSPMAEVASMLTGLTTQEHGAGGGEKGVSPLGPEQTPLAEYLVDHGYITGAVLPSEPGLPLEAGLEQGFKQLQAIPGSAEEIAILAEDWMGSTIPQPLFLFVRFPANRPQEGDSKGSGSDGALGTLLQFLAQKGLLDSSLIAVSVGDGPGKGLYVKGPGQIQASDDPRSVAGLHLPQILLEQMALPVASVRPNSYFTHPLEPAQIPAPPAANGR